jgi:large subunit ribosomal protein L31
MKKDIHPTYFPEAKIICACGNTWTTGSTQEEIRTDVCFKCHPFFTGEQRIVDTEGQVDRFYKKLQARQDYLSEQEAREAERVSPERPIAELGLSKRSADILAKAEMVNVGDVLKAFEKGEQALLDLDGFGRKSLSDLKKALRKFGYELPEAADELAV